MVSSIGEVLRLHQSTSTTQNHNTHLSICQHAKPAVLTVPWHRLHLALTWHYLGQHSYPQVSTTIYTYLPPTTCSDTRLVLQ